MSGNGKIFTALLVLMVCAFGFGIYTLQSERFERGDIYPPYSSYRSDPLDSRAFFLALQRMPGIGVRRNFLDESRLSPEKGATFFYLGVDVGAMRRISKKDIQALEDLAGRGNRLVFAFAPVSGAKGKAAKEKKEGEKKGKTEGKKDTGEPADKEGDPQGEAPCGCLFWRWKIIFNDTPPGTIPSKDEAWAVRSEEGAGLPETIPMKSSLSFRPDAGFWRTLYSSDGNPVIVEREFGKGSIVLLADSYLTSQRCDEGPALSGSASPTPGGEQDGGV